MGTSIVIKKQGVKFDSIFFVLWCTMWFVIDLHFSPDSLDNVGRAIKLILLVYVIAIRFNNGQKMRIGLIGGIFLLGFLSAVFNDSVYAFFREFLWGRSKLQYLVLILILMLYINSLYRLEKFIKYFLVFAFLSVTIVGLLQYFLLSNPIFDFGKNATADEIKTAMYYFNNHRLTGLVIPGSNNASLFLLILFNYFIIKTFLEKKRKVFFLAMLLLQIFSIYLTYTRAAWIALFISLLTMLYFGPKKVKVWQLFLVLTIMFGFYYFLTNFLISENAYEYNRLFSDQNVTGRFNLYSIFIDQRTAIPLFGYGLTSDASENFSLLSNILMTVENNYLNIALYLGIPFALFLVTITIRQLIILMKNLLQMSYKHKYFMTGLFLFLSQTTTIIINNTTTNKLYITILLFGLIAKYLEYYKKHRRLYYEKVS